MRANDIVHQTFKPPSICFYAVYANKEKILNILMKLQLGFSIMEMLNIQERVFNFCGKEKR